MTFSDFVGGAGALGASFFGVVSLSRTLTAFTVASVQPADEFLWPTVNDLRLGQTTVPEPGTVVLLATGLLAMGVTARRRSRHLIRPTGESA